MCKQRIDFGVPIKLIQSDQSIRVSHSQYGSMTHLERQPAPLRKVKQIAFEEFVNKIVKLRPDKPSSVLDIAELRYCLQSDVRHNNGIHQRTLKHVFNHQDVMEEKAEVGGCGVARQHSVGSPFRTVAQRLWLSGDRVNDRAAKRFKTSFFQIELS